MNKQTIAILKAWGCDMDAALERVVQDEELLEDCLKLFYDDAEFFSLKQHLEDGDTQKAFDSAHTLKGVSANLGLTPLYKAICAMVEPLRAGKTEELMPIYDCMMQIREEYGGKIGLI